jgi:H+/Cl- antiporter ClcA
MDWIRAHVTIHVRSARWVVVLAAAAGLFAGLLAMHATGAQHASQALAEGAVAVQLHGDTPADSAGSSTIGNTHCAIDCDEPLNAPSHVLMTACVIALLVLLLLLATPPRRSASNTPQLLQRLSSHPVGRSSVMAAPSLPMLSISRT